MPSKYKSKQTGLGGGTIKVFHGYQDPKERLGNLEFASGRFETDDPLLQAIRDTSQTQRCGGGRRILRKATPE